MFRYWLNQNNSRIQLINLASLIFLDFDVIFMRLQNLGITGETCLAVLGVNTVNAMAKVQFASIVA